MKALIIVDVQNDYCPGGAVAVPDGDKIVPVINKIMRRFDLVIASRDWHPENSVHFRHWPPHCLKKTKGSEYHPDLKKEGIHLELLKGTRDSDDGYSAFEATNINLGAFLRQKGVESLYICGLMTEHCVKNTVLDSVDYGFDTFVVSDAIRGLHSGDGEPEKSIGEMKKAGARLIASAEIPDPACE